MLLNKFSNVKFYIHIKLICQLTIILVYLLLFFLLFYVYNFNNKNNLILIF